MADLIKVSQLLAQVEWQKPGKVFVSQLLAQVECVILEGYNDGVSSGGLVFGGEVVEIGTQNYIEAASSGGLVISGAEFNPPKNYQTDGLSTGGIAIGGTVSETWINPWAVAVKGGTYRIGGVIYTLDNVMSYEGLGEIAALIILGAPPTSAGQYRYDLLSIDDAGDITVTVVAEATTPVMPSTPTGEVKLDHILRYYGQESIKQADIGKLYEAPRLSRLTNVVTDDELAWAELSTTITVKTYDQYGVLYTGSKVINASFVSGNGTISPLVKSGTASSFTFTYTRDQLETDISSIIQFVSSVGLVTVAQITLLDESGDPMF
ncbi:MAG: hypothetical protein ABIJ37_03050 [Pseudomonadota bacterium]